MTFEELQTEIERLEALVFVPGLWSCPKCKFQTVRVAINADTGEMGTVTKLGADSTCPNCKTALWRVLERDAGNEMADRYGKLQTRTNQLQKAVIRIRAHTAYIEPGSLELLAGLLASIQRLADVALDNTSKEGP